MPTRGGTALHNDGSVNPHTTPIGVEVVLCTWNGARWLPAFLRSLVEQDRPPAALVVRDDASTDDTVAILRAFAADAPFPVEVDAGKDRLGSTRNFERALTSSRSPIVALADQDDLWDRQKLARAVTILDGDPTISLATSDAHLVDEHDHRSGQTLWEHRGVARHLTHHRVVDLATLDRRPVITGATMVLRRRVLDLALPFPPVLDDAIAPMRHDRWLALIAAAVGTVLAVPEPLMSFRRHPSQETGLLDRRARTSNQRTAVGNVIRGADPTFVASHGARARQLDAASTRADDGGDFLAAEALRLLADHHRFRAGVVAGGPSELGPLLRRVRHGGYGRSPGNLAEAASDIARALRPRSATSAR